MISLRSAVPTIVMTLKSFQNEAQKYEKLSTLSQIAQKIQRSFRKVPRVVPLSSFLLQYSFLIPKIPILSQSDPCPVFNYSNCFQYTMPFPALSTMPRYQPEHRGPKRTIKQMQLGPNQTKQQSNKPRSNTKNRKQK